MIRRACYVTCDGCGDPADVECFDGALGARRIAFAEGFVRIAGKDICSRCQPEDEERYDGE